MTSYPHLKHQCCRLKSQASESIVNKIVDNCSQNDSDVYPPETGSNLMQFDMTDEENGYPCVHLTETGCGVHDNKPNDCHVYPTTEKSIQDCTGCNYTFDEAGNRSGDCNGCNI